MYKSRFVNRMMKEWFNPGQSICPASEDCREINVVVTVGPEKSPRKVRAVHEYLRKQDYAGPVRVITVFNGDGMAYHDSGTWGEAAPDVPLYSRKPLGYAGAVNAGIKEAEKYGGLIVLDDGDTCFADSHVLSRISEEMRNQNCAGGAIQLTPSKEYGHLPGIRQFYGWNTFWTDYMSRLANIPLMGGIFPSAANGMLFFRAGYGLQMDESLPNKNDVYLFDEIRRLGNTAVIRTEGVQTAGDRYESNMLKAWADKLLNEKARLQGKKGEIAPLTIVG
jgi:hypothetical protein